MISRLTYWFRLWRYKLHELPDGRCAVSKNNIFNRTYYDFRTSDHVFWWRTTNKNFKDCLGSPVSALRVYQFCVGSTKTDVGTIVSYEALAAKTKLKGENL